MSFEGKRREREREKENQSLIKRGIASAGHKKKGHASEYHTQMKHSGLGRAARQSVTVAARRADNWCTVLHSK